MDGLDAALVRLTGRGVDGLRCELITTARMGLGPCAESIRRLARGEALGASEITQTAGELGRVHGAVVRGLVAGHGPVRFVAAHGQTVHHRGLGRSGDARAATWQILDPWPIARAGDCPVVFDLRGADIEAGGEGAPITPLADWVLFRTAAPRVVIVNLGGFCNATWLESSKGPDGIEGRDLCACNHVINGAAMAGLGKGVDRGGEAALRGSADRSAIEALVETLVASGDGRSLGIGDEGFGWVEEWSGRLAPDDLLASAVEGVARVIGAAIGRVDLALLAGGGANNKALAGAIERHAGIPVETSAGLGVPVEAREAMAMAVLGALSAEGASITLPNVTGRDEAGPIGGAWVNLRGAP